MNVSNLKNCPTLYFGLVSHYSAEALTQHISEEERTRADQFKKNKDRDMFIVSKAILRNLISKYINKPKEEVNFEFGLNGKPFIEGHRDLQFNLAHSEDALLIGFTNGAEIGVDIEDLRRTINENELAAFLFSERELETFKQLEDKAKHSALLKSWTCKEAFLKAKGSGLTFPIKQLELSFSDQDEVEIIATQWDEMEKEQWDLRSFNYANNYRCAFVVNESIKSYKIHSIEEFK